MDPVADQYKIVASYHGLGVRHFQSLLLFFVSIYFAIVRFPRSTLEEERHSKSFWEMKSGKPIPIDISIFPPVITYMLGGYLTTKVNNKYIILVSVFANTLLHYAYPVLSEYPIAEHLIYLDFAFSGMILPCIVNIMVRWLSSMEITYICPLIFSGTNLGRFVVYSLSKDLYRAGGQFSVHYFFANCGLVWCLAYGALGASEPDSCWYISKEEKNHILTSLSTKTEGYYRRNIPWRGILTCLPLYVAGLSYFSSVLALNTHIGYVQFAVALHFEGLHPNTLLEIFFAITFIFQLASIWLHTFIFKRNTVSKKTLRYTSSCIGQWGAGVCYLLLSNSHGLTDFVIFGVLSLSLNSVGYLVAVLNFFDLSRNYVGLLFGFIGALAQLVMVLYYVIFLNLINNFELDIAWRAIFFMTAIFLFLCNFIFTSCGSVEVQKFDALTRVENKKIIF